MNKLHIYRLPGRWAASLRLRLIALDQLVDHELAKDRPDEAGFHAHARRWVEDYLFLYRLLDETCQGLTNSPNPPRAWVESLFEIERLEECLKRRAHTLVFGSLDGSMQTLVDEMWAGAPNPPPAVADRVFRTVETELLRHLAADGRGWEAFLEGKRQEPPL